jgi:erythromycin esterase
MRKLSRVVIFLIALLALGTRGSSHQSASSAGQVEAQQLEQRKPVERELKRGETHVYRIALDAGQFLDAAVNQRGIDLIARVFAPDGGKIAEIDSPNGTQGDEPITLEVKTAGTYRVEVSALEQEGNTSAGRYEIRINEIVSAAEYARRLADKKRKQQAVTAWLKENAIPLQTVEAGNRSEDLQPLKRSFKDVRFVGLGEQTHGTREFFQFKHRMLEFLVREMGFRVFAIEASYSACENINDYVMGRTDDGAKALDSQGFWTWNTEEVRSMIDWMRTYNAGVPADRRVKFIGFDIQFNETGKTRLLDYLKRVAPERVPATEEFFKVNLDELNATVATPEKQREAKAKLKELQVKYSDLFVFLELTGASLTARSSPAEYAQMREYARVLVQYIDSYSRPGITGAVFRDLYMADNFRRAVEREPLGTRFVVWAHNGHISTGDNGGTYPTLGYHLRRFYGKDYYAMGFSFDHGSFQSREAQPKDPAKRMLMAFTASPAPAESIDWHLAQTGVKTFVVDFRAPGKNPELGEWLSATHPMRMIGSIYAPSGERASFAPTTIDKQYDGLFFVRTTTRARPNQSVKNVAQPQ